MNIGFDFRMGGSFNSGIGRYSFELLKAMLENLEYQHKFFVFYNKNNVAQEDLDVLGDFDGVSLVETNARHYSLAEQTSFLRILNNAKCDLVHFPNFNVPVWYKRPFVVTIHDMVHHKISGHKKSRWFHFQMYKYVIDQAAKNARRVITVSESSKSDIIQMLGVSSDKVKVVYEGVSTSPQDESVLKHVKKTFLLRRPYFLFVGTLERKKNLPQLTKAFDLFLDRYKLDMDLVIAGKVDRHYPQIKEEAMKIKHRDHLVFTDYVFDHELAALYQGAYAFISASLHEGFCLPAVEAMQYGLPVLVSNLPVFNEVCDNGALYFDPNDVDDIADKIKLLAKDSLFYKHCSLKSQARGSSFSWQKAGQETFEVYDEALGIK